MPRSQWHRLYTSRVAASPEALFALLSDLPDYDRWLPPSEAHAADGVPGPAHQAAPGRPPSSSAEPGA
jgi:hypothetical protein